MVIFLLSTFVVRFGDRQEDVQDQGSYSHDISHDVYEKIDHRYQSATVAQEGEVVGQMLEAPMLMAPVPDESPAFEHQVLNLE